jgi:hypothetical protein
MQLTNVYRFVVVVLSLILCFVLLVNTAQGHFDHAWGTSSSSIIPFGSDSGTMLLVAWMASSPQIVLSFCYFAMNSECTSMVGIFYDGVFKNRVNLGLVSDPKFLQDASPWICKVSRESHWNATSLPDILVFCGQYKHPLL